MNYSDFLNTIKKDGAYTTPPSQMSHLARRFSVWATIKFYAGSLNNVLGGYKDVRLGRWTADVWAYRGYKMLATVESAGAEVTVEGVRNAEAINEPVVYIANHMSLLETFALPSFLIGTKDFSFVLKESLLHYPLFGVILRHTQPIAVGRKNPRKDLKQVLEKGVQALRSGRSVIIFPQATRSSTFQDQNFNSLGARLAVRARVPAVPVALRTDFLRPGKCIRDLGPVSPSLPVRFAVGKLLRIQDTKALQQAVTTFIRERLSEWGCTVDTEP